MIEEAISCYNKALKIKPNDARTHQKLQSLLAQHTPLKDPRLESLYQSLASQSNDANLYYKLGKQLNQKGLIEEAIKAYVQAIEISPTFSQVYNDLNHATLCIDDLDKVIPTYRRVIDQYPNFIPAYINLANSLNRQGKIPEAQFYRKKAIHHKTMGKFPEFIHINNSHLQPEFIIIGAEKCGTSSLYTYITKHPQILGVFEKEIHFFTYHFNYGLDWYLSHFPKLPWGYLTGEASTSYIGCHNNAPQRLFNLFPEVKLLAILRYPIDRAVSHYHQLVRLGREGRKLEDVINQEIEILTDFENIWELRQAYWKIGKGAIWHSLYVYFLEEWLKVFSPEQFLILSSDTLFINPQKALQTVWDFWGLPAYNIAHYPQYN